MKKYHLPQVASTNSYLLSLLAEDAPLEDELVVYTLRQTDGRGQVGNSWESTPDLNIAFSVLLYPGAWMAVSNQFELSIATSLAIRDVMEGIGLKGVTIKWPNDIYVGDKKIAGILIENRIFSSRNWQSVIGVGINVNQEQWVGNAPNPTSILLESGLHLDPEFVLDVVILRINTLINEIKQGRGSALIEDFRRHLYRAPGTGLYPYVDTATGVPFNAETITVEPTGILHLRAEQETEDRLYTFKEVKFVLPCGTVKE